MTANNQALQPLVTQQYEAYKNSGVEWLGQVPEHWEVKRVKDIVSVKRGASPRPIDDPIYFDDDGEFSWVRIADLSASERYLLTTKEKLSKLGASRSVKRYPNDFILSIAGTVGKPIITKIKCCIHDGFVWFPNLKINPEYWYYCFSTEKPYQGLGKLGTQLNLNTETVGLISLPLPPKNETAQIIDYLDQKTAQIDHEIDLLSKKTALYSKLKQSLINETVTRGLDKNVALKDSGVEWLGQVPEHWGLNRHKDNFSLVSDRCVRPSPFKVALENIQGKTGRFIPTESEFEGEGIEFKENDILFGKLRPYLAKVYLAEFNGSAVGDIFVYRPKRNTNSKFAQYLMLSDRYIDVINSSTAGTKMPRVSSNFIANLPVSTPPLPEQKAIADYLDQKTAQIDSMVSAIDRKIATLQELRKTLINDVVTGQIKVI